MVHHDYEEAAMEDHHVRLPRINPNPELACPYPAHDCCPTPKVKSLMDRWNVLVFQLHSIQQIEGTRRASYRLDTPTIEILPRRRRQSYPRDPVSMEERSSSSTEKLIFHFVPSRSTRCR